MEATLMTCRVLVLFLVLLITFRLGNATRKRFRATLWSMIGWWHNHYLLGSIMNLFDTENLDHIRLVCLIELSVPQLDLILLIVVICKDIEVKQERNLAREIAF